jgi:hypothetical protein
MDRRDCEKPRNTPILIVGIQIKFGTGYNKRVAALFSFSASVSNEVKNIV